MDLQNPPVIPDPVIEILKRFQNLEIKAYLVGGCLRDYLLQGTWSSDWDIVVNTPFDQLKFMIPDASWSSDRYQTLFLKTKDAHQNHLKIDLSSPRRDDRYLDHRHPKTTFPGSLLEDAQRRDFTINAMYYDPLNHDFFDPHHGRQDLLNRCLRCVGSAEERFSEDALRLVRALRFKAQLQGFHMESNTASALQTLKSKIQWVALERLRDEIEKCYTKGVLDPFFLELRKYQFESLILGTRLPYTSRMLKKMAHHKPSVFCHDLPSGWLLSFILALASEKNSDDQKEEILIPQILMTRQEQKLFSFFRLLIFSSTSELGSKVWTPLLRLELDQKQKTHLINLCQYIPYTLKRRDQSRKKISNLFEWSNNSEIRTKIQNIMKNTQKEPHLKQAELENFLNKSFLKFYYDVLNKRLIRAGST